jgi:hypothetical protein
MARRTTLALLLFTLVAGVFSLALPITAYLLLPETVRNSLNSGESVGSAILIGLVTSALMGLMAYVSYRVWLLLGRRFFGREFIDRLVATWSSR